jgi:hypothetical protein
MSRVRRGLAGLLTSVLVVAGAATAPGAGAAESADQNSPSDGMSWTGVAVPAAQTFTVGVTGALTRVTLPSAPEGAAVQIRDLGPGGAPGTQTLATGYAVAGGGVREAVLRPAVPVVAGERYAIVLPPGTYESTFGADVYAGGQRWILESGDWNGSGSWATSDFAFTTYVEDAPVAPTLAGTPTSADFGDAYSYAFTVGGTPAPHVTVTAGDLPEGLSLSPTGVLSGTPGEGGEFPLTLSAVGYGTDTLETVLRVDRVAGIDGSAPDGELGEPYDFTFDVVGHPEPGVSVAPGSTLPAGLTLTSSGRLHGTPTQSGPFSFVVEAFNGWGWEPDTLTVDLDVVAVPTITGGPWTLTAGDSHTLAFAVEGYPEPTVEVTDGELPDGMTLSDAGVLTGTPTVARTYDVTVTATNDVDSDEHDVTLTVQPGAAATGDVVSGGGQVAEPGAPFAPLELRVRDAEGNTVEDVALRFTVTKGDASFPGGTPTLAVTSGPDGLATAAGLVAGSDVGPVQVTAELDDSCPALQSGWGCLAALVVFEATFDLEVRAAPASAGPTTVTPLPIDADQGGRPDDGAGDDDGSGGTLADTGTQLVTAAQLAVVMLLLGLAAARASRRRRAVDA